MPLSGKQMLKLAHKNGVSVSIPVHANKDLKKGIENSLKKQLGVK